MPASSARRLSVSSPHWPRTSGRRSAFTSVRDALERALQAAEGFRALFLDAKHLLLCLDERLANGSEHRLDRFLASGQRCGCGLLVLRQVLACELQEQLAVRT